MDEAGPEVREMQGAQGRFTSNKGWKDREFAPWKKGHLSK